MLFKFYFSSGSVHDEDLELNTAAFPSFYVALTLCTFLFISTSVESNIATKPHYHSLATTTATPPPFVPPPSLRGRLLSGACLTCRRTEERGSPPTQQSGPYPTDGEKETWLASTDPSEAVSEPPVEEVLRHKGDEGEAHGGGQHVEDASHVVHVQLTGHHLVLLVVTNARQPLGLQFLHLTWRRSETGACGFVCCDSALCDAAADALYPRCRTQPFLICRNLCKQCRLRCSGGCPPLW